MQLITTLKFVSIILKLKHKFTQNKILNTYIYKYEIHHKHDIIKYKYLPHIWQNKKNWTTEIQHIINYFTNNTIHTKLWIRQIYNIATKPYRTKSFTMLMRDTMLYPATFYPLIKSVQRNVTYVNKKWWHKTWNNNFIFKSLSARWTPAKLKPSTILLMFIWLMAREPAKALKMLRVTLQKIYFKKQRLAFFKFFTLLKTILNTHTIKKHISGISLSLKGKINRAGCARKQRIILKHGTITSSTTASTIHDTKFQVATSTGALGVQCLIHYKGEC